jgi:hypothetical protein
MAKAGKKSSTSPPKQHELSFAIRLPQHVSLKKWWVRAIDAVVARLRRGRPPIDRRPYIALAEELIKGGVDPSQDAFVGRLRSMLELPKEKIPLELKNKISELQDKNLPVPGNTVLTQICAPIYKRELAKIGKK